MKQKVRDCIYCVEVPTHISSCAEGEKIEKHPHEGCVFHALNVYDRVEIPINARGLIYFVLMEVHNNLTITCSSEESHGDRETLSSVARALTRIDKKLDKLIKLHNHDQ